MHSGLPLVSIVVPMRNESAHIGNCLDDFVSQDYPASQLEILVIDGHSEDTSADIALAYAHQHRNIQLIDNPGRIIAKALNIGIRASHGEFIVRADCKARYSRNYIRTCIDYLTRTAAESVGGPCLSKPGADSLMAQTIAAISADRWVMGGSRYRTDWTREEYCDGVTYGAWPRTLFAQVGYFNENLERGEDNEFNGRILRAGGRIFKTPNIAVYYHCRPNLTSFLLQTFQNASWHFATWHQNPDGIRWRHLAPAAFLAWIQALIVSMVLNSGGQVLLQLSLGLYAALLTIVAVRIGHRSGHNCGVMALLVVPAFHFVYGMATWLGPLRVLPTPAGLQPLVFRPQLRKRSRRGLTEK